jgi:ribosomal-protein-alanine N-acetyltransferase
VIVRAPETFTTARLALRRPALADAPAILARYASDPEVTRWLGWARHRSVDDAIAFVRWSDQVWGAAMAGPYLVFERAGDRLIGSTGLDVETPWRAATGYVLARDAWGRGYATEATLAMSELADAMSLSRLYALCHVEHRASAHVLAKAGFTREGILRAHSLFPNLDEPGPCDVECWARTR